MNRLSAILISIWLGMQLTVGYVVAPTLFRHLERTQAGNSAGEFFDLVAYLGLFAWTVTYFTLRTGAADYGFERRNNLPSGLSWMGVLIMLLGINQFAVTPAIKALKANEGNWLLDLVGGSFAMWHGISSTIYMVCSLLGAILCIAYLRLSTGKHAYR